MNQMLIIGMCAVPLETDFTGNFRIDMGESMKSQKLPDNFLPSPLGIGDPHGNANQAHQS
jgi:hypothetical protein